MKEKPHQNISNFWDRIAPTHWKKWLLLCFLLKGILFVFFAFEQYQLVGEGEYGPMLRVYDDTRSYYTPIENLLEGHGYSREGYEPHNEPAKVAFAGRLPGFLPIYAPLYYFFGKSTAGTVLVLIQFLLSTLSVYVLALIAYILSTSKRVFLGVLVLYALSYPIHMYDHCALMESFSISMSIFAIWTYLRYLDRRQIGWLWLTGLLFCWIVALRPIFGTYLPVWVLLIAYALQQAGTFSCQRWAGRVLIFCVPLMLLLSGWTIRNIQTLDRRIVLEDEWKYSYPYDASLSDQGMSIRRLIIRLGGDMTWWTHGSMGNWFFYEEPIKNLAETFPPRVYYTGLNADSLLSLKQQYHQSFDSTLSLKARRQAQQVCIDQADRYRKDFESQQPLQAYVYSGMALTYSLFCSQVRHDLPFATRDKLKTYQWAIKAGYIVKYYLFLILGLVGWLYILFKEDRLTKLISLFPIMMILGVCFVTGMVEDRYLAPFYLFLLLFATIWLDRFIKKA